MGLNDFTYRPLLQKLTLEVNDQGLDPYEAYQWLQAESEKAHINADYYLSTSITSGGHARDNELDLRSIIDRNTESARLHWQKTGKLSLKIL